MKFLTRLRPRPLARANSAYGLRHARAPCGTLPEAKTGAQKFHRAAPGTCGVGVKPMRKSRQATESEGEAFRMSEHAGRVSEMYRGRPSMPLRIFAGCPSLGHFLGHVRKVTKGGGRDAGKNSHDCDFHRLSAISSLPAPPRTSPCRALPAPARPRPSPTAGGTRSGGMQASRSRQAEYT